MLEKKIKSRPLFLDWTITYRSPGADHQLHFEEGISKKIIEDVLKSTMEVKRDPRKLRKRIQLFNVTQHLSEHIRITIIFQIFPKDKHLHVINAFLGSFHRKNLFEKMGLKGGVVE